MLEIKKLNLRFHQDDEFVIKDINISVKDGEFVLLGGPSGSGKSTLVKAINGLIYDQNLVEGDILLNGKNLACLNAAERSLYIGSVMQNADEQIVFADVEDELAFPLENMAKNTSEIKKNIYKYSSIMNLDICGKTSNLSGGAKQKLVTASTLSMAQDVFVFDEPMASLDNKSAEKLILQLKKMCKEEGKIVIFVEHRIDLLQRYVDRSFYLSPNDGTVKEYADFNEFKRIYNGKQISQDLCLNTSINVDNADNEYILKLENLGLKFGKRILFNDFNYNFIKGGKYVINGPNSCGKTSLLKLIVGIYKPSTGKVIRNFYSKSIFKHVAYVMQNPNYQLFMPDVKQEIFLNSKNEEFTYYLIDVFNLRKLFNRHPQSLSEGEKRRLGLASMMAMQKEVLILDEPSVGQDFENIKSLLSALKALSKIQTNLTVITVTHDLRCDKAFGDIMIDLK